MLPFCNMLEETEQWRLRQQFPGDGHSEFAELKGLLSSEYDSGSSVKLWQCICVYF